MSNPTTLAVPLKLDAFVLNPAVSKGGLDQANPIGSKIAPITQPNYTFLRLKNHVLQPDILDLHDLHNACPASRNPRLTDLGTGEELRHRQGVYIHWSLPRVYRSGLAASDEAPDNRDRDGINGPDDPASSGKRDKSAPQFRLVPTRWLVVRRLHPGSAKPEDSEIPEVQAWVVESDRLRDINDIPLNVDLQTDVAPYVASTGNISVDRQAEVFIGQRFNSETWEENVNAKRVPVSLLTGGNMLFADYQPHNSNVFSFIDNFGYTKDNSQYYLSKARASYYVIGWHAQTRDDPFHGGDSDRLERLKACLMKLNNPESDFAKEWLAFTGGTEVLCHGAMYEVDWDVKEPPKTVLADVASEQFHNKMPLSVGTTPLDSLLAYIDGHREDEQQGSVMRKLMDSIVKIQTLLIDKDDSVDAQRAAADLLYNYNYKAAPGGTRWYLGGSGEPGKPVDLPSETMIRTLDKLNDLQYHLDVVLRTQRDTMWELFSRWWKFVSDAKNQDTGYMNQVKREVKEITDRLDLLEKIIKGSDEDGGLQSEIDYVIKNGRLQGDPPGKRPEELLFAKLVKKEVMQNYHQQLDPTVMVAGIESAWPDDFMDPLKVRPSKEISSWGDDRTIHNNIDWSKLAKSKPGLEKPTAILEKMPVGLQKTAQALLAEFFRLVPDSEGNVDKTKGDNTYFPQFHDQGGSSGDGDVKAPKSESDAPWRDRWGGTQPWFPLILEWEVQYFHVNMDNWSLEERLSTGTDKLKKLRYGIKDGKVLKDENINDVRTLTGRVLILPQAGFSLKSKIDDILDNTPPKLLKEYIPDEKEQALLRNELHRLKFLSAPFSGLHDHLVTRSEGAHLKPNIRRAGEQLTPLEDAKNTDAGFGNSEFLWMGTETDLTPYGTLVRPDHEHSLFKPATHGQFRITKLNIIDKFGQAIHATDPRWSTNLPPPIYPYISEFYAPQFLELKDENNKTIYRPNTITYDLKHEGSEYMQLAPHINQLARVNASFVTRGVGEQIWKPQHEWDNPIWGWLVINYAQYGLQAFLPDGRFYREIQLGGRGGARTSEKWLPFDRPDIPTETRQLDSLLDKLANAENLQAFVDMINGALGKAAPAPEAYAQFLNSIVGKPLALVNVGWSLELATPEYTSQNTNNGEKRPERYLLEHPDIENPPAKLPQYSFRFKLGDEDRSYDGLLGYFDTLKQQDDSGNDLNLKTLFTFFKPNKDSPWTEVISSENYPTMPAYHTPALVEKPLGGWEGNTTGKITTQRNSMLQAFGVVMDPFTPIHLYSGILPIKELRLPTWTWQEAMGRMTAFFRVGPLLQPKDVEAFDAKFILKSDYELGDKEIPNAQKNHKGVIVPGIQEKDGWRWLQPYVTEGDGAQGKKQVYMPLMVQPVVGVGLENGPYKALEGYLQLQKAIVRK